MMAVLIVKHAGPGPHPGTGTPQQAHAGGGAQVADQGDTQTVERTSDSSTSEGYVSPIEHSHDLGQMPPELEQTLIKGRPITRRFKETMATKNDLLREIDDELNHASVKVRDPESKLWAVERKTSTTVGHIAMFESSRYPGIDRTDQVKAWILDPANGDTYSERIQSFRSMMRDGSAQKLEIELTKSQLGEVSEWEGRGEIVEWTQVDDPGIEIEELRTRNGRIKGGILHIKDEASLDALKQRSQWVLEDARMGYGDGGGTPGKIRSMEILHEKLSTAVAPVADPVEATDTFWAVTLHEGSGPLWEQDIKSFIDNGNPMQETTFLAGEIQAKFVGPIERVGDQWEIPEGATRVGGTWQWNPDQGGTTHRSRLVSSENLVDRLLTDAEYLQPIQQDLTAEIKEAKSVADKLRAKRRNLHRDMVAGFLESENIRTGTEINVASKRGSAKKLANDSRQLPAVWVEEYNAMTENRPLTVHKKRGGGTYFSRNFQKNKGGPHIQTDGSVSTNLHEIGHGFEDMGGMKARVKQFFDYRTNHSRIQSRHVNNGRLYSDSFTDTYSGKKYDWGDHEILSNGIGNLYGGHRGTPDDEHLDFLFGLMVETATDD